jgi:hypothetical protein
VSAARDALAYLEALHGARPQPSVIVVTPTKQDGRFAQSHFVRSPDDALPYVLGNVDVYVRITPIARKPARGRGVADDAVALPAVWAELDVNGTPARDGAMKTGAFPSVEAAVAVAGAVLEPSMLVASGGGVHPYWLLDEPLELRSGEDRDRAKRLVEGFQARLRREARERFDAGLDSTHDLARVLRPPGSMNGKGSPPKPVELLDDGGRRYALEELAAEVLDIDEPARSTADGGGEQVDVRAVLARHEDLAKLASRRGGKPGDGSASAWDFALGCRAAEHSYDDAMIGALIRHARRQHGEEKGERDDYVPRTVEAVRERVGYVGADSEHDDLLAELTKAIRVGSLGRRVASTFVAGHGNTGSATIALDDGYTIEFEQFEHVAQPAKLADQLATTVGITTEFSKLQARRVAALVRLSASREQELRNHGVFVNEAMRLLDLAPTDEFDQGDQLSRWEMWQRLRALDPDEPPDAPALETDAMRRRRESGSAEAYARRMLVPIDRETRVRFVLAGWLQEFMRRRLGSSTTPHRTKQTMMRAGWRMRGKDGRIKATDPDSGEDFPLVFYLVPAGWVERQTEQVQ